MSKRRIAFISGFVILVLAVLSTTIYRQQNKTQDITFAECENMGGVAWQVDLYHPEICSSCAEYRECEIVYNDDREACPECYGACQECQEQYSLYESCPECYGSCQACQNKYLNDFESDTERYERCPECEKCNACREEIEIQKSNCPPCISCNDCREKNKRDITIDEACPQVTQCTACLNSKFPYPDHCPAGKEKIGEISDAATWFMCCQ